MTSFDICFNDYMYYILWFLFCHTQSISAFISKVLIKMFMNGYDSVDNPFSSDVLFAFRFYQIPVNNSETVK